MNSVPMGKKLLVYIHNSLKGSDHNNLTSFPYIKNHYHKVETLAAGITTCTELSSCKKKKSSSI